ncbi:hypothetical protein FH972_010905 [Carpinus fangiana]|uniref:Uncharacterized protein n=1 Tax=Carpinus fangiana TaxID=176857 RepID=A0A660KWN6_9ROSI|nr:hypothetical protein FH972_010905 [Carpinus fangiana]
MASLGFSGFSSVCFSVIDSKHGWKILYEVRKLEILRCINQKIWHQHQGSENLPKQVSQIFDLGDHLKCESKEEEKSIQQKIRLSGERDRHSRLRANAHHFI